MRKVAIALTTLLAVIGLFSPPAHGATPQQGQCDYQDTLCAGQSLYTTRHTAWTLQSSNRHFLLYLVGPQLWLQQTEIRSSGRTVSDVAWKVHNPKFDGATGDGTLSMQRNGNLVQRTRKGAIVWSSHTAGTGHHNRVTLRNTGDLVMRSSDGRVVWSSHTGRGLLIPGQGLASGQRLINRFGAGTLPLRLTMSRAGDLILRHGSRRTWHSGTHVTGSTLRFRPDGRLVVVTPAGRAVWHTRAFGKGSLLRLELGGRLIVSNSGRCWSRPAAAGCTL